MEGDTVVKEAVVVGIGSFLATIIDFLVIALVVFLFVKAVNTARSKLEKPAEEEAPAAPPEPSSRSVTRNTMPMIMAQPTTSTTPTGVPSHTAEMTVADTGSTQPTRPARTGPASVMPWR